MAAVSFLQQALINLFAFINDYIPWHKLPTPLGVINILTFRWRLRSQNLFDTYPSWEHQGSPESEPMPGTSFLAARNSDGKFNDLKRPLMGCSGMRFGRNVPREFTKPPNHDELMNPNPREISEKLLQRKPGTFKPATIVNLLAAAWIQFQVHDWANHFDSEETHEVPLKAGDQWSDPQMKIFKTKVDPPLDEEDKKYPAYANQNTMWWDASQLYGSCEAETSKLRTKTNDGKLIVSKDPRDKNQADEFLPRGEDGLPKTGFAQNWWLGLELMHTLFALEHNAIADALRDAKRDWSGEQIFDTARIINCALMAKIHTVEWTPAILNNPVMKIAMNANWWGILGKRLYEMLGRLSTSESIGGIPGSGVEQDGAPYCLTEEFVSVYRLHPLIPDDVAFFEISTGKHHTTIPIKDLAFTHARTPFEKHKLSLTDVFYSFGINYPGAITVHNTPNFLRDLHIPDGRHYDMGVVDILRDRERGVPRYNQFRRLFHMAPVADFLELTGGNATLALEVQTIYGDDIEKVDLLVGCLCEPCPAGFGFSDTAFRVFILMATRRIKSDRFLAEDWKPEVYTHEGINWVQDNTMSDVLIRHFPELKASLRHGQNAFAPWEKIGHSKCYLGKETNKEEDVVWPEKVGLHEGMVNGVNGDHCVACEHHAHHVNGDHHVNGVNGIEVNGFNGHHHVNGVNGDHHANGVNGIEVNGFAGHHHVNGVDGVHHVNGVNGVELNGTLKKRHTMNV